MIEKVIKMVDKEDEPMVYDEDYDEEEPDFDEEE